MTRTSMHPSDPAPEGAKLSRRDGRKKGEKLQELWLPQHDMPRTEAAVTAPGRNMFSSHLPLPHVVPCPPGLIDLHRKEELAGSGASIHPTQTEWRSSCGVQCQAQRACLLAP